ncbi:unnamed protein product [Tenebrio molitor]|nr:unnamed protein product [Tenebrio molitor]
MMNKFTLGLFLSSTVSNHNLPRKGKRCMMNKFTLGLLLLLLRRRRFPFRTQPNLRLLSLCVVKI